MVIVCVCTVTPEMRRMLLQMANGIAHLHSLDVVHRDLKPQNILVDHNHWYVCVNVLYRPLFFKGAHLSNIVSA